MIEIRVRQDNEVQVMHTDAVQIVDDLALREPGIDQYGAGSSSATLYQKRCVTGLNR